MWATLQFFILYDISTCVYAVISCRILRFMRDIIDMLDNFTVTVGRIPRDLLNGVDVFCFNMGLACNGSLHYCYFAAL